MVVRKIFRNISVMIGGEFASRSLGLALAVIIARYLGDVGYGAYVFAFGLSALFIVLADFGLKAWGIRELSRIPESSPAVYGSLVHIKGVLGLFSVIMILVSLSIIDKSPEIKTIILLAGVALLLNSFSEGFSAIFYARERMMIPSMLIVSEKVVRLLVVVLIIVQGKGLVAIALASLISNIALLLVTLLFVSKVTKFNFALNSELIRRILRESWPFAVSTFFVAVYLRIDTVMLSLIKGEQAVGLYAAAYLPVMALTVFPTIIARSVFPLFSRKHKNREYSRLAVSKAVKLVFIFAMPLATGLANLSGGIVDLAYGPGFTGSVRILTLLSWALIPFFINVILTYQLFAMDKQVFLAKVSIVGAVVNIILNLLLIPSLSYFGAAISAILTNVVLMLVFTYYLSSQTPGLLEGSFMSFLRVIGSTLVMLLFLQMFALNVFVEIVIAGAIYTAVAFVFGVYSKEDLSLLKKAIR